MPVFMIRWPNGDIAFTSARNKEQARYNFDEFAEPMNLPIRTLKMDDFCISLRMRDDFTFEVDYWGESMADALHWAYPVVARTQERHSSSGSPNEEEPAFDSALRHAVREEQSRVKQTRKPGQKSFLLEYVEQHGGGVTREELRKNAADANMTLEEYLFARRRAATAETENIPLGGKGSNIKPIPFPVRRRKTSHDSNE